MPGVRPIDANSALNDLCGSQCGCRIDECGLDEPCEKARCIIRQPTIEPEVKHGRWINKGDYAVCSECDGRSGTQYNGVEPIPLMTQFCPNCGAKMSGGDNDAESD